MLCVRALVWGVIRMQMPEQLVNLDFSSGSNALRSSSSRYRHRKFKSAHHNRHNTGKTKFLARKSITSQDTSKLQRYNRGVWSNDQRKHRTNTITHGQTQIKHRTRMCLLAARASHNARCSKSKSANNESQHTQQKHVFVINLLQSVSKSKLTKC